MTGRQQTKRNVFARILNGIVLAVTLLTALVFVASAYSGMVSPSTIRVAPILILIFPIMLLGMVGVTLIELIWWRRTAFIGIVALVACLPRIWDFCPFHLPKGEMDEVQKEKSLSVMTYNVLHFLDQHPDSLGKSNKQLDYILSQSPDLVCLEEAGYLGSSSRTLITNEQIAELSRMYPYVYHQAEEFTFLSKFKAEPIDIRFPAERFRSGNVAAWRVYAHGKTINVFGVHLCSFKFDSSMKELFKEVTSPDKVDRSLIKEARYELAPRVVTASMERAEQVHILEGLLRKFGGETTILCGDFNDPVGGYALTYLERHCGLKQTYPQVGFGPMITFNANHFFFRIDHILYRGALTPYSMTRGNLRASDHYPVIATFVVE